MRMRTRETNTEVVIAMIVNLRVIGKRRLGKEAFMLFSRASVITNRSWIREDSRPMKKPAIIQPIRSEAVLERGKPSTIKSKLFIRMAAMQQSTKSRINARLGCDAGSAESTNLFLKKLRESKGGRKPRKMIIPKFTGDRVAMKGQT
jgi:hypothetical protein